MNTCINMFVLYIVKVYLHKLFHYVNNNLVTIKCCLLFSVNLKILTIWGQFIPSNIEPSVKYNFSSGKKSLEMYWLLNQIVQLHITCIYCATSLYWQHWSPRISTASTDQCIGASHWPSQSKVKQTSSPLGWICVHWNWTIGFDWTSRRVLSPRATVNNHKFIC